MGFSKADIAVGKHMPKINPLIGNGISFSQMQATEQNIDQLMRVAFSSNTCNKLPAGFNYLTYEVLSSEATHKLRVEQIKNNAKPWRVPFSLAKTDSYLIRYIFENKLDPITSKFDIFIPIPYVRRGGVLLINDKPQTISAVIKSRGLSVTEQGYFIKFLPNKVKLEYFTVSMIAGDVVHVPVPITKTLHRAGRYSIKRQPCLPFWLYAQHGLSKAFKLYLNTDIKVVPLDSDELVEYRASKLWVVCEHLKLDRKHKDSLFAIAVDVKAFDSTARSMIASIFHLVNELGDIMIPSQLDDPYHWKILLGKVIFGIDTPHHHILSDMDSHTYQIESYMDVVFMAELISEGIEVDDIYDFLFYVVKRLATQRTTDLAELGNLWGRYYTTLEYVLYDLQNAIMHERWSLQNAASSTNGTYGAHKGTNYIRNSMRKSLGRGIMRGLAHSVHGEVKALDTTSDNLIIGGCAKALDQSVAQKFGSGNRGGSPTGTRARLLRASHLTHGSILNLQQGDPTPINTINPYGAVDKFGKIYWADNLKSVVRKIALNLHRKSE